MSHPNNPMVSKFTRRCLTDISSERPELLGEETLPLLFKALWEVRGEHPGGLVFSLARAVGVNEEEALRTAHCALLFFCACNLTDDLQDGDVDYLGDTPLSLQLNTQSLLYSLAGLTVEEFIQHQGAQNYAISLFRTVCAMLSGQHLELQRDSCWDVARYEKVAEAIAGRQFAVYFGLVALALGEPLAPYEELGVAFGVCSQILVDKNTQDERYLVLNRESQNRLKERAQRRYEETLNAMKPEFAQVLPSFI